MKVSDIVKYLDNKYPPINASDFDQGKIGLQFGSMNSEVKKVMISLDGSSSVIEEAIEEKVDMLVLHHPFMFYPMLSVNYDNAFGRKMLNVLNNRLNIFAMHTNFDVANGGMNDILASILELQNISITEPLVSSKTLLRIGEIEKTKLIDFIEIVKEKLDEKMVKYVGADDKQIKKVGIVGGSGSSEIYTAIRNNCDVLITGELHHHNAYDALDSGMALIEVSHSVERFFAEYVKKELENEFPSLEVIISKNNLNPYKIK